MNALLDGVSCARDYVSKLSYDYICCKHHIAMRHIDATGVHDSCSRYNSAKGCRYS
jgi:hypothetical protein